MPGTVSFIQQSFPGQPKYTEKNVPDLTGKVMIVTGSNTGLGKEIAQILYSKNARVYMMARSAQKTQAAIDDIKAVAPRSTGQLIFIPLDLADLTSVKTSAEDFLRRETKLHVLFNNAGVGYPEKGSKTKQGHELQLGVNCIGSFALTQHLTPTLISTAKTAPPASVRVVWVSSSAAEAISPKDYVENLASLDDKSSFDQYCVSKLGNYLHASEYAARHRPDGVLAVSLNPGALDSEFWRTTGSCTTWMLRKTLLHPPVFGAYTCLFAGVSPEVTLEKSGSFGKFAPDLWECGLTFFFVVAPWGKLWQVSKEMVAAARTKEEGGTGIALRFWNWTEDQVKPYL